MKTFLEKALSKTEKSGKKIVYSYVRSYEYPQFNMVKKTKTALTDIKREIMKLVVKTKVVTTSEIATELEVSWNTAEKHLLELTIDGKVIRMKKTGVNLWVIK